MVSKAKYNYWHIITHISREYKKQNPELKVGLIITHPYKKDDEWVCLVNFKTAKDYRSAYHLKYLGRILKTTPKNDIFEKCKSWIKEKGYEKYLRQLKEDKTLPKKGRKR